MADNSSSQDDTIKQIEKIAQTIRKAQYGKDVREAIALGFELIAKQNASIASLMGDLGLSTDDMNDDDDSETQK